MTVHRNADYVYRNADDTVRVRVHRREGSRWDYDVFRADAIETYSEEAGDDFVSKRDALAEASRQHGPLRPIATKGSVVDDAWRRRAASRAPKKSSARLSREIAAVLDREDTTGVFYLTDASERALGSEHATRLAAKRAAMRLVRAGVQPRVEVWHRWHGGRYMQGLADAEGWTDV